MGEFGGVIFVHPDPEAVSSQVEVGALAAEAKKGAKQTGTSNLFVSRRRKLTWDLPDQEAPTAA